MALQTPCDPIPGPLKVVTHLAVGNEIYAQSPLQLYSQI